MSETSQGPGWWMASDQKWYPPTSAPPPPPPPPSKKGPTAKAVRRTRIGCLSVLAVVVLAVIVIVIVAVASGGGGSNISATVVNMKALDGDTVRIYMNFKNNGSSAGSATCVINTTVNNQFGDLVKIEVNSTGTNGNIPAHGNQVLYQDIGVPTNDSLLVTPKDVQITDCS